MTLPEDDKVKITFKDVAGAKEAKQELAEIVDFLKNPKKFLDIGARIPKGILLMGAPGTGKTLLARAVAGEAGVAFFSMSGSEFVEMFVGVGASRVRDLFKLAKVTAPAIIFIDEIDAVGRVRGTGMGGGNDEREQTLNQILVEMDGFEPNEKVIVMAATNRPDVLDPALLRPGRFDRRVTIDLPDRADRLAILEVHSKNKPFAEDVQLSVIAERTPGFSGADLHSLMNEGAILAARENRTKIGQYDLIRSIEKVMLGPERKSHILSKREKELTAYHEAGHALLASVLEFADPVHKVSIISRGRAAGYTLKLPLEDRKLQSKKEFLDDIVMALGGYVVERDIFGDLTTGASNDLQVATSLARDMVTKYGMSDKIGPVALEATGGRALFGQNVGDKEYSDAVGLTIDQEVSKIMNDSYARAQVIINEKREALNNIAKALVEAETLERAEFEKILVANGIVPKKLKEHVAA
jgi:cell division protease FtsH